MTSLFSILAIDPSEENTGLVFSSSTDELKSCTLPVQRALAWLKMIPQPNVVLLERPALGPSANAGTIAAWKAISWQITAGFPGARIANISPGNWKAVMEKRKLQFPASLKTKHERDAYAMLMYWKRLHV